MRTGRSYEGSRQGEPALRFLMLLEGDQKAESFETPRPEVIAAREAYRIQLRNAGALLDA